MSAIVVVGAGREGKGYLGNIFCEAGWEVTFLDKDPFVIHELQKGRYTVTEFRIQDTRRRIVEGYSAFVTGQDGYLMQIVNADAIALCLYPQDIAEATASLLPFLKKRVEMNPGQRLSIFPCTNELGLIPIIRKQILDFLDEKGRQWFDEKVTLVDTVVRRPVGAQSSSSLELEAGVVCPMLVGTPVYADFTGVPWIEKTSLDIDKLKELKVHTINTAHAACAYTGYLKGFTTIDEALEDSYVREIRDGVLAESVPVLAEIYSIDLDSLWKLAIFPESKEPFRDPITRVAFDPIRKLSRYDRLTSNACMCMEHGIDPVHLIQAIAYGMCYDAPDDEAAQRIQEWISKHGIDKAVSKVTGLNEKDEIVKRVSAIWRRNCRCNTRI